MKIRLLLGLLLLSTLIYASDIKVKILAPAGTHSATLTWNASTAVCTAGMAYNAYRGTTAGGENYATPLNPAPGAALTYTDNTVIPLATYFYTVKAYCSSANVKESIPSNEAPTTIPGDVQPSPPPSLTVTSQ